jgi:PEP-CTERM motif
MARFMRSISAALAAAAASALASSAYAQSLPAGDLVIVNTTNTAPDAATGNGHYESVELQAYNVSGSTPTLDATVPLPGVTLLTSIDDDRHLKLSVNGQLLSLAGYNAAQAPAGTVAPGPVGDDSLYAAPAASVNREVVSVNAAGQPTYVNLGSSLYDTSEITGAITVDGSQYYLSGEAQNANDGSPTFTAGGAQYVSVSGGTVQNTFALYDPADGGNGSASLRSVEIAFGQLYYSTGSSSFTAHGVHALGTGVTVPTSDTKLTNTLLGGQSGQSVNDETFLDLTGSGQPDVAYYAAKNGIAKYINNDNGSPTAWVSAGLIADTGADNEMKEITAQDVNGVVNIFAVDGSGNLFKITDSAPETDSLSGTLLSAPGGTVYTPYIAASDNDGGNMFFGGVDFAPASVPEPASLSLLTLGSVAALARRRNRKA